MSAKHEAIKRQVMIDWTAFKRGTLWPNSQVTVKKTGRTFKAGLGKGTADIVGIEHYAGEEHGIWTSIEVKTWKDWLSDNQIRHCKHVLNNGGNYYLALEMSGCTVDKPEYRLYRVYNVKDVERVRDCWGVDYKDEV